MSEARVVDAFCAHLRSEGWDVRREVKDADVEAHRNGERIIAEAKGHTSEPGLDIDTMFGQLLRRMTDDLGTTYVAVAPVSVAPLIDRIDPVVLSRLRVHIYLVGDDGSVSRAR